MHIAGLQPLSLLDYPGKPCSIIFTQGCIFRCSFCHNPDLIPITGLGAIDTQEVFDRLEKNKKMVDAVTVTGGEPTIQSDIVEFISELKTRGFFVKLDSSGIRPDVIEKLLERKLLDYIAMDIKHVWERYVDVTQTGKAMADKCKETLTLIQQSGVEHEFRTTIFPGVHCENDFIGICSYLKDGERYFIQETSFKTNLDPQIKRETGFSAKELLHTLSEAFPHLFISLR